MTDKLNVILFALLSNLNNDKKTYTLILAVSMLCRTAFAQSSDSKVKFGIKAGVNFANISQSYDGDDDSDTKAVTSFHFGGYADLSISPTFSIQPGLTLSGKGLKEEYSESEPGYSYTEKGTTNVMYLEVPVNFVYGWMSCFQCYTFDILP